MRVIPRRNSVVLYEIHKFLVPNAALLCSPSKLGSPAARAPACQPINWLLLFIVCTRWPENKELSRTYNYKYFPQGFYCLEGSARTPTSEFLCPLGHYCEEGTATPRGSPCPAGTAGEQLGQTSRAACRRCREGRFCPAGNSCRWFFFFFLREQQILKIEKRPRNFQIFTSQWSCLTHLTDCETQSTFSPLFVSSFIFLLRLVLSCTLSIFGIGSHGGRTDNLGDVSELWVAFQRADCGTVCPSTHFLKSRASTQASKK